MYYFGKNFSHTQSMRRLRVFRCEACSSESHAWVTGIGSGHGHSPYLLGQAEAAATAKDRSARAALASIDLTLSLAVCPSCGRFSRVAWVDARLPAIVGWALVVIVVVAFDWWYAFYDPSVAGIVFFTVIGLFVAWGIWSNESWKWRTASVRTEFIGDEEARLAQDEIENAEAERDARAMARKTQRQRRKRERTAR